MFYFLPELWIFFHPWDVKISVNVEAFALHVWVLNSNLFRWARRFSFNVAFSLNFTIISRFMMLPITSLPPHTPPAQFISHLLLIFVIFFIFSLKFLFFFRVRLCWDEWKGNFLDGCGWMQEKEKFIVIVLNIMLSFQNCFAETRKNEFSRG